MPSSRALSTRFSVIPLPGKATRPVGRSLRELVVAPERSRAAVGVPVGPEHHLVHRVVVGPARGDALRPRSAAVHQHHVGVALLDAVERGADGVDVARLLAACDRDEGPVGQVRLVGAVLAGAQVIPGVDGGGGELRRVADVRAAARAPGRARLGAVGAGGVVAHLLERVAAVAEGPCAIDGAFELVGVDLRCRPGRVRGRGAWASAHRRRGRGG